MAFMHSFPAVRGLQAGRACYIAMCPMRIVPTLFKFDEEDVPADLRAQRKINLGRIPEISSYLIDNPRSYTLSAITASVDGPVDFRPIADTGLEQSMGTLSIPMDAQILINDGQHRRAAIERAIRDAPELGYDNIPVLFFADEGLERSQQMFADLNKHAIRPSTSISTLYDLRDHLADLARHVSRRVDVFERMTELEKSSVSNRSTKLFTLSAIKGASRVLLKKSKREPIDASEIALAVEYWTEVSQHIPDWKRAKRREVASSELREQYVHAHGVALQALGIVGSELIARPTTEWKAKLKRLNKVDWTRDSATWNGRAVVNGRISKASTSVQLTANYLKQVMGMPLSSAEQSLERSFVSGKR